MNLYLDFETRSVLDLNQYGTDRYSRDPSTRVLMLAYAFDDKPVKLWEPHLSPFPSELREPLASPAVKKIAWHASFERTIFCRLLHIWIPYDQWIDPMIYARHLSMPGNLEDVGRIIGLPQDQAKMKEGAELIRLFCEPAIQGGDETLFGTREPWFRDWGTNPVEWATFCDYGKRDVEAERTILKKLSKFPLPEMEQRGWELDQKINDTGMPIDLELVRGGASIAERAKTDLNAALKMWTQLENPNSREQMLGWLRSKGYPFNSLVKPMVDRALNENEISPEVREVLLTRKQASKTSDSKFEAIVDQVGPDGRLRFQYQYLGSARAGRWASHGCQLQNMPRPTKAVEKNLERAIELLRLADYEAVVREFELPMEFVSSLIRSVFRAPEGKKFVVCDLNAIENRVIGWISGCQPILDVFYQGRCPYLSFAVELYGKPYEVLEAEYNAGDKEKRTAAKPAVLGAGYRLGGGDLFEDKNGDIIRTGLWGYASNMGIDLPKELCHLAVRRFRDTYTEVVDCWFNFENAVKRALRGGKHQVGPLEIQKIGKVLRILLPSGRGLHYINPKIEKRTIQGSDGSYEKDSLVYDGIDIKTKQWTRVPTHGGKLLENATQAVARDLLLHSMILADNAGFEITGSTHDEIISLTDIWSPIGIQDLQEIMNTRPEWAPDLPLGSDGFEGEFYRK